MATAGFLAEVLDLRWVLAMAAFDSESAKAFEEDLSTSEYIVQRCVLGR